jgi:predicted esterase
MMRTTARMGTAIKVLCLLAPVALALIGAAGAQAGPVSLPFSDDFNDTVVGPWVQTNGTYTHNGSTLGVVAGAGVGGASVEVPGLGGAGTAGFTATVVLDPTTNATGGFGLLSGSSNFGAANNKYYLVDIAPNSGGQIRIAQIDMSGSGTVGIGDTGLITKAISYSNAEVYTLTVTASYGPGGLTLDYTVTSTGGDNVNLVVTDPTPLTGQYFGIETFGGQTVAFDDFLLEPAATGPDPVLSQDIVNGDPDLDFGTLPGSGPFSASRTVRFVNDGPNNSIGISAATLTGDSRFSLGGIAINGGGGVALPQTLAVGDFIEFTVTASLAAPAAGITGNLFIDTAAPGQDKNLPVSGTFGSPPTLPPVTNEAPAAGKRVRVTAPGSGYEGNPNVYHTLYLPPDWVAGSKYPVIVEYAPNQYQNFVGNPEDTQLGFHLSGGTGYIWASMPCIHENGTLSNKSDDYIATTWYGASKDDDAAYTKAAVIDIIGNYGGDHASVFVTGFSRGAIACGELARHDATMADIWLGFLPYAHTDYGWYDGGSGSGARTDRVNHRASLITYGQVDSAATNSRQGVDALIARGFPVESYEIAGTGHTDEWITDANTPVASSASYSGHPPVADVRARMRAWLAGTASSKPGTSSISGVVTDSLGNPIAGVRVQSGLTHWTFTDATGAYQLAGLVDGSRDLMVSHPSYHWTPDSRTLTLGGADLTGENWMALPGIPFVITGASFDGNGDFIIDFTGPANSTFEVRKGPDPSISPLPISIIPKNAPVTTNESGVGHAVIDAADASEAKAFFQLVLP